MKNDAVAAASTTGENAAGGASMPRDPTPDCDVQASSASTMLIPLLIVTLPLIALSGMTFMLPVLAPAMMPAIGRPATDFGWVGAAMGLGSVAFFLANRAVTPVLGPIGTLRLGLAATVLGGGLILTSLWPAIIVGAVCMGFGYATNASAGAQILTDFTPQRVWGTLFSVSQAGVPLGGVLAAVVGGATLVSHGWTVALASCAGIAMAALAGVALLPERFNSTHPLEPFQPQKVWASFNLLGPVRSISRRRGFPVFVTAGWGLAMGHAAVAQFFVLYVCTVLGVSVADAALLFAVQLVSSMVARIGFGALADWSGAPTKVLAFVAATAAVAGLVLVGFPSERPISLQILAAAVIGVTSASWNGLYAAEIARRVPPAEVATATADCSVFIFLAYMVTPPLVGALVTQLGWRSAFLIIAGAPMLSGVLLVADVWKAQKVTGARGDRAVLTRNFGWLGFGPRPLAALFASGAILVGMLHLSGPKRPVSSGSVRSLPMSVGSHPDAGRKP